MKTTSRTEKKHYAFESHEQKEITETPAAALLLKVKLVAEFMVE